jgi:hypothetical protein
MYAGYGAMMISRQMVTILSPALLADERLGFTVKDIGDILAFGTMGAMIGKLSGDRWLTRLGVDLHSWLALSSAPCWSQRSVSNPGPLPLRFPRPCFIAPNLPDGLA